MLCEMEECFRYVVSALGEQVAKKKNERKSTRNERKEDLQNHE